MIIQKKCHPKYFEMVKSGKKKFELRLDNFDCNEGDILELLEWNPKTEQYTGRKLRKKVTYVLKTNELEFWTPEEEENYGYQIMSLEDDEPSTRKTDTDDKKNAQIMRGVLIELLEKAMSTGKSRSYLLSSNRFAKLVCERLHKTEKIVYKEATVNLCQIYFRHVLENGLEWKDGDVTHSFGVYLFDEDVNGTLILAFYTKNILRSE